MRETKQLRAHLAAAAVVVALAAPSVFAESSPSKGTKGDGEGRATVKREAIQRHMRGDNSSNGSVRMGANDQRSQERIQRDDSEINRQQSSDRAGRADRRPNDSYRPSGESGRWRDDRDRGRESNDRYRRERDRNRGHGSYRDNRSPYRAHGRIHDVRRYGNGYRVWIAGAPYPFFVPASYYHRDRFRVGLVISLGGYYNPLGYYDYYNDGYRGGAYSRGELRGTVESIDYRRDTFVIRNEATGSFVTVISRDRRPDHIRPGDYVEIYGAWSRAGVFTATDVDLLDEGYYRR